MTEPIQLLPKARYGPPLPSRLPIAKLLCLRPNSVALVQSSSRGCTSCGAQRFCMPKGLTEGDALDFEGMVSHGLKVKKGHALFHAPQRLISLYAVRVGAFKTTIVDHGGRGQITGFQMPGEMLGLDAIADGAHTCSAVALEDSEVCVMPYASLQRACTKCPTLQSNFNRLLSQLLIRDQQMMLLMGNLNAEQRLSTFLLSLSERYRLRGYSPSSFILRMSREDISGYLGLRLETVCRAIAQLREREIIECHGRTLNIIDVARLNAATES